MPSFASTDIDYLAAEGTFTVRRLLDYIIKAGSALMIPGSTDTTVFQINHVRVREPKANDNVYTNVGDQLFPRNRSQWRVDN